MAEDILKRFGSRVRILRKRKGMSQERLALEAGLDRSYVGQVERGECNTSIRNIAKIAKGLRVPVRTLFTF
jgi:transcriptional regulator with XRE-family HTH domain